MEQPPRFVVRVKEEKVYWLKKALYGLKQAPQAWYVRIDDHFSSLGFEKSPSEPTIYGKKTSELTLLIVSLYVDDLLVIGSKEDLVKEFKQKMEDMFDMSDLDR